MVKLNKIYTRTGDDGSTGLGDGARRSKADARVEAYGEVDELNSFIGAARLASAHLPDIDRILAIVQNDLFDLGADLCRPPTEGEAQSPHPPLRIAAAQVERLERAIDALNDRLAPLRSFVLPGGTAAAAHLHVARVTCRRAERAVVKLLEKGEEVGAPALAYLNRLSDYLFVAARIANDEGRADVLWTPGAHRDA